MACLRLSCRACHNAPPHLNSRRLMQGFLYGRLCPGDNEYAHPLDLSPIVDLNQAKVVHIDMAEGEPQQVRAEAWATPAVFARCAWPQRWLCWCRVLLASLLMMRRYCAAGARS